ncbi:hypothetical protein CYLTODRAFT_485487 [Cylindrobasidium torrendii FP15055 ss-10]|uniref:HIT-type domain-containing protein n=1 Tax=Cylindrobasidium torrendii FP15055 ss-10 TaxID=1314674 RepID=A0A0D7BSU5_9AGAR|nr:hypothetical protein CYLTODRAFT_485487 [Cylindrobasidium torrendii FP15055 ss-10]
MEASTSRSAICPICSVNPTKYTCPRCSTPSCSLSCSKEHKVQASCSGERNKAAYVPMNKYGWGQMMNDYTYLEDVGRRSAALKDRSKDPSSALRKGKHKRDFLQSHLAALNMDMELLPVGMSRRKLNQSTLDSKTNTVYLTVEVRTHAGSSKTVAISHRHKLETRLDSIIDAHSTSWCTLGNDAVDLSSTLGDALNGRSFVEFPTFDVWEERPRALGPQAMKGLIGGYGSEEEDKEQPDVPDPKQNMAGLGAYGSDSEMDSDLDIRPPVAPSESNPDEVDWDVTSDENNE